MEESRLVMVDEQGNRSKILNWTLYQRVQMMDQNLARAVQNLDFELIGLRIQSFPIIESSLAPCSAKLRPCRLRASFRHMLGITGILQRYMAAN
jgi:hypothetical protein